MSLVDEITDVSDTHAEAVLRQMTGEEEEEAKNIAGECD